MPTERTDADPTRGPAESGRAPGPAPSPAAPRRWTTQTLLGDDSEAFIEHAQMLYRLRVTSTGKLILTK